MGTNNIPYLLQLSVHSLIRNVWFAVFQYTFLDADLQSKYWAEVQLLDCMCRTLLAGKSSDQSVTAQEIIKKIEGEIE